MLCLYRIAFERTTGDRARLTIACAPRDALRMAARLVSPGYLLGITEQRCLVTERPQLTLIA